MSLRDADQIEKSPKLQALDPADKRTSDSEAIALEKVYSRSKAD